MDDDLQGTMVPAPEMVPKPPGWHMILTTSGNQGWHLISRANSEEGAVTVCGLVGRAVSSTERMVVLCPSCAGGSIG